VEPDTGPRQTETLKLTDQYIALLVLVLMNSGLLDVRFLFLSSPLCKSESHVREIGVFFVTGVNGDVGGVNHWDQSVEEGYFACGRDFAAGQSRVAA